MTSLCKQCSITFLFLLLLIFKLKAEAQTLKKQSDFNRAMPAAFVFGDSTVDPGNNNYIGTPFTSNHPPYGRDFKNHIPTGRFTNGRLVTDFAVSYLGIKNFMPPFLDPTLSIEDLTTGVSFASAGSGFDPLTPLLLDVISMEKQLEYFREYRGRVEKALGRERTQDLIKKAAFVVSAGTNDFVVNYFGPPVRRKSFTPADYIQFLMQLIRQFVQGLVDEGARNIAVVGLAPMGCLPVVITLNSANPFYPRGCIERFSSIARDYNQMLQTEIKAMQNAGGYNLIYADIYTPLDAMIKRPRNFGFEEVNIGCCGTGYIETTIFCSPNSAVCSDASKYVFWDSIHPTDKAYRLLFQALRPAIDQFISKP